MEGRQLIISIGRQCGSGGHEIGEKLASYYGIKLYDRNVIPVLAERMQKEMQKKDFGNARGVRNLCDSVINAHNARINSLDLYSLSNDEILSITEEDL